MRPRLLHSGWLRLFTAADGLVAPNSTGGIATAALSGVVANAIA